MQLLGSPGGMEDWVPESGSLSSWNWKTLIFFWKSWIWCLEALDLDSNSITTWLLILITIISFPLIILDKKHNKHKIQDRCFGKHFHSNLPQFFSDWKYKIFIYSFGLNNLEEKKSVFIGGSKLRENNYILPRHLYR